MGYRVLPRLVTEGPDLATAFQAGTALKEAGMRNALLQEQIKDLPAEREWRGKQRAHEEANWEAKAEVDRYTLYEKKSNYVRDAILSTPFEQAGQVRQKLSEEGFDVSRIPESFESPEQWKAFQSQASQTLDTWKQQFKAKLDEEAAVSAHGRTTKLEEYKQGQQNERGRLDRESKERLHEPKLYQLSDGSWVTTSEAKGKKGYVDPNKIKLDESEKSRIKILEKSGEAQVKIIEGFRSGEEGDIPGRPKYTQKQADAAIERLKEIQGEVDGIVRKAHARYESPNALLSSETPAAAGSAAGAGAQPGASPQTPQQVTPATPTTQPKQPMTKGMQVARLVAIHRAIKEKGKDPLADPRVKAATDAFMAAYPDAQALFDKAMSAGEGIQETPVAAQPQTPAQPGQNLTVQEFGELIAKEGWSPDRAAKEAANMKIMDEGGNPIDFESFKSLFSAVRGADQWTATYLKNAYNTYVDTLSSVGNAILGLRIPGTGGMRNALAK